MMTSNTTIRVVILMIAVSVGVVVALRHIPVGSRTFPWAHVPESGNIPVSAPRYLIPRELAFPSQIGTSVGILPFPDPHFAATAPVVFEYKGRNGVVSATAQGFDINYRFEREELRRSVLAVQEEEQVVVYEANETCFRCWPDTKQLFFLGQSEDAIAFIVQKPLMSSQEIGILTMSLPVTAKGSAKLIIAGTEEFKTDVDKLVAFGINPETIETLCRAKSKSLSQFVLEYIGHSCSG